MIWLHGASLGDLNALTPMGARLQREGYALLVSAVTESGRARARSIFPEAPLVRPPLLSSWRARRLIHRWAPRLLLLERLELWPRWLSASAREGLPVVVLNGRVGERTLQIRSLLRAGSSRLALFCAQSGEDAARALQLGVPEDKIYATGDSKYDQILQRCAEPPSAELRGVLGSLQLVIGCLHRDEEAPALRALAPFLRARSGLRVLIAPRYMSRIPALQRRLSRLGVSSVRRSENKPLGAQGGVCLLDSYGELASVYQLAPVALIGGTFGRRGGQNILEPARWGVPVIFGPGAPSPERAALADTGGLLATDWEQAFTAAFERPLSAPPSLQVLRRRLCGAFERQWAALIAAGLLPSHPPPGSVPRRP